MIKGKSKIYLYDAKTGEQTYCAEDTNMITKAVERLLNPPAYWGFNCGFCDLSQAIDRLTPISTKMLGGIMLWGENIPEDENIIMPPNDNALIGHAGNEYAGDTLTRGSYNLNESGPIVNENGKSEGYRHVWDFETDKANGIINCITLTSKGGGNSGWPPCSDGSGVYSFAADFDGNNRSISNRWHIAPVNYSAASQTVYMTIGYGRRSDGSFAGFDMRDLRVFVVNGATDSRISLNQDLSEIENGNNFNTVRSIFPLSRYAAVGSLIDDSRLIYPHALLPKEITLRVFNIDTGEVEDEFALSLNGTDYSFDCSSSETMTWINYDLTGCRVRLYNGYIYFSNGNCLYKFTQNGAFVKRFSPLPDKFNLSECNGKLFMTQSKSTISSPGFCYWTDAADVINVSTCTASSRGTPFALYDKKPHFPYVLAEVKKGSESLGYGGFTQELIFRPYIGSINNLDTPIIKTTAQTMKIVYEIYQE